MIYKQLRLGKDCDESSPRWGTTTVSHIVNHRPPLKGRDTPARAILPQRVHQYCTSELRRPRGARWRFRQTDCWTDAECSCCQTPRERTAGRTTSQLWTEQEGEVASSARSRRSATSRSLGPHWREILFGVAVMTKQPVQTGRGNQLVHPQTSKIHVRTSLPRALLL